MSKIIYRAPCEVVGTLSAVVTLPTGFDPASGEKLPVILFLHGAGERGDGSDAELARVCVHGVPKLFTRDPDHQGLRAVTISPQCPTGMVWTHIIPPLMAWFRAAAEKFGGDLSRAAVTGLSMGGYGTWELLCTYPDAFVAAAPICGGGSAWRTSALRGKRLRVFHGLDDNVVPFEQSLTMVRGARAAGAEVSFTASDLVGHNSWVRAYESTDLIRWLVGGADA